MQRPENGHGRAGEEAQKVVEHRKESRDCGVEGGDGPDHGAAVSGSGTVAQRAEEGTAVADSRGSVWRGMGRGSATDSGESRTGGQDPVRVAAAGISRPVQRRADPDAATADQTMAGDGGAGAGSVLLAEAPAAAAVRVPLAGHQRARKR